MLKLNKIFKNPSFNKLISIKKFLTGNNTRYEEQMYQAWKKDPHSVHVSWKAYFENMENGLGDKSYSSPPNHMVHHSFDHHDNDNYKIRDLIRTYRELGYLKGNIDPVHFDKNFISNKILENLDYKRFGFVQEDLEREFELPKDSFLSLELEGKFKLKDLVSKLVKSYSGDIGVEFRHILNKEETTFITDYMETKWMKFSPTKEELIKTYTSLAWATKFEVFLEVKFHTKKFGLEGLESIIPGLQSYFENSSNLGVKDISIGMAHRGRLNILTNCLGKPLKTIIQEVMEKDRDTEGETFIRTGDVKYHLGYSNKIKLPNGKDMNIEMLPNPSHLECVNPIVQGKVRAKQHFFNDSKRREHQAILLHGDAAFCGQGVNYENMQMTHLKNFTTGGIIHVIMNNQIGFTTTPEDGRSSQFPSDLGKAYDTPIIHVNGDNPMAVEFAFKFAADFSRKFYKDVIVDVIAYRRHGHYEQDQPFYTQPKMYNDIKFHKDVLTLFEEKLIKEGFSKDELYSILDSIDKKLHEAMEMAKAQEKIEKEKIPDQWKDYSPDIIKPSLSTGVNIDLLKEINHKVNILPKENINIHPTVRKVYQARHEAINHGVGIDWAMAESLAWAVLLSEGKTVRLTGEDVQRGTFSHRHSYIHDQKTFKEYRPLDNITPDPKNLQICLSHLSEFGVLGYELGFSIQSPDALVIWEAQFGDFTNEAQVIVDEFISSGETKWNSRSGLVLYLPHGLDGQGPEHSSARVERFLDLLDDDADDISLEDVDLQIRKANIQVCNPTTPGNYFHLLLRQMKRSYRKPLVMLAPKRLLRQKDCFSNLSEMGEGTSFINVKKELNQDIISNAEKVKTILLCQGQVYYDLITERTRLKRNDIAVISLEQIAPVPYKDILDAISVFPNAKVRWVQEEHKNNGAWPYLHDRLINLLKKLKRDTSLIYAGRPPRASPGAGITSLHELELRNLLNDAFRI